MANKIQLSTPEIDSGVSQVQGLLFLANYVVLDLMPKERKENSDRTR